MKIRILYIVKYRTIKTKLPFFFGINKEKSEMKINIFYIIHTEK